MAMRWRSIMDPLIRIDQAIGCAVDRVAQPGTPPRLAEAMRYAVFPGGARIRPRLCIAVAQACLDDRPEISDAAATAIELLHCASLVHDDLPCFDDAECRRGKPSVHKAFGEELAVLVGDGLIVLAFEELARSSVSHPARVVELMGIVCRSVGAAGGIIAGQGWESEPSIDLQVYQRAKTGALFAASTEAGAAAAGAHSEPWRALGEKLGEAYQVADDIRDVIGNPDAIGKPTGRDEALDRPSAVRELGLSGAKARLKHVVDQAVASIPNCPGKEQLRRSIFSEAGHFLPPESLRSAA